MKAKRKKNKEPKGLKVNLLVTPFHVLFFSVYPVIFLYNVNIKEMDIMQTVFPAIACLAAAVALFAAAAVILRDFIKAGFASSIVIVWFFSYGHLFNALSGPLKLKSHYFLFLITAAVAAAAVILIIRAGKKSEEQLRQANLWVNYISIALVFYVALSAALNLSGHKRTDMVDEAVSHPYAGAENGNYPDIYYIILDGHARGDYMKKLYGYDDSQFEAKMSGLGFYIPEKAKANYPATVLSFASFLNYKYLDKQSGAAPGGDDRLTARDDIKQKKAVEFLKSRGYSFVLFPSIEMTNAIKKDADYIFTPGGISPGEFGQIIINTSALAAVNNFIPIGEPIGYEAKRRSVMYAFNKVPETAKMRSPKIVLAHIVCPHPPFVFDENGGAVKGTKAINFSDGNHSGIPHEKYLEGYRAQARFTDKMTLVMAEELIKNMKKDSIIIIHGDHGSGSGLEWESPETTDLGERLSIFSAYYLPGGGAKRLYPGISPVNNFRLIFKYYFNEKIELLPDRSYFSKWSTPYDFIDVTKSTQ